MHVLGGFYLPRFNVPHTFDVTCYVQGCINMMWDDAMLLALVQAAHELRQLSTFVGGSTCLSPFASTVIGLS